jgi:ribosomal protein S18 acetylase RimI-like enzyme
MTAIALRELTGADASNFQAMRLEALATGLTEYTAAVEDESERSEAEVARILATDMVIGAFAGERLVGSGRLMVGSLAKTRHKGRIVNVYVRPSHRRAGIARRIVLAILERALGVVERIDLSVTATNEPASHLYESLSFEPYVPEKQAFRWDGRDYDKLLMTRRIEP